MKFKIDNAREMERLAKVIAAFQHEGISFYLVREMNPAGDLSDYVTVKLGKE